MNPTNHQKLGNPIEPVNRVSDYLSNTIIPNTNIPYSLPTNFIDIHGKNPSLKDKISTKNIAFNKEELTEYNWLFTLEEHKEVVKKAINAPKWKWIVIRSNEMIEEIYAKENLKKQREAQNQRDRMDNFKFEENPQKIDPVFIVAKYKSLKEFIENKTNWLNYPNCKPEPYKDSGNFDGGEKKITEQYQSGDEIWHYSEFTKEIIAGSQIELFLLIRNNKVICSPLINHCLKCIF